MMDVNTNDARIGSTLNDRYRIIERIAAGGMAVVYRGERLELGRPVAIKFLQEIMLQNPKFITRFESEARAMSKLSHPYCVSVIDFGVEGAPYIVMDFVEGETLKSLIAKEKVSVSRAIILTRQILAGIAHAHGQGIIHRDIKPENIMLQEAIGVGEQVRIFDFGLAKLMDAGPGVSLSHSSLVAGTPNYMSPEQSRGQKVDERTDLYSIGVVFFELLTGRKPFIHDDFLEVVRMHREAAPPSISELSEHEIYSPELQAVVERSLAKDPAERFQTVEAFTAALDATPEGERAKAHEAAGRPDPKAKTLPVGTMSPFEHVDISHIKHTGEATENVLPEGLAASAEAPAGFSMPVASEPPRPAPTPLPTPRRFRRSFLGAGAGIILLAAVVLAWPGGDAAEEESAEGAVVENAARPEVPDEDRAARDIGPAAPPPAAEKAADPAHEAAPAHAEPLSGSEAAIDGTPPLSEPAAAEAKTPVTTVADVRALLKEGKKDDAVAGLQKLRREQPRNALIVFMLANLYFEKMWLADAVDHYREAIRLDPEYRKRGTVIRNLISMLSGEKVGKKAMYVLQKSVGRPALPLLRKASKRDKNPLVRRRAAIVHKKIKAD